MEDQNDSGQVNSETPPAAATPQVQPPPARPPAKAPRGSAFWLKVIAGLYAFSLLAAFPVINKADSARKTRPKELELSKLTGLAQKSKDAVAVVPIYGAISQGSSSRSWERGSEQTAKRIAELARRKDVKAIVLDINTPGGSVGAVQEIYSTILRAKAETHKPFIARFGEVSASGGYYVAAACDRIIAEPGTLTGSIGVIFSVSNFEGLMKKVGYKNEAIKSGKFKDIGSAMREMTPEEHKLLQGMIDDSYEQFVAAVATGRKMTTERVKALADGRIFTGRQAKEVGLVDSLGDLRDALDAAGEAARIGKNPRVVTDGDPLSEFLSLIDSRISLGGTKAMAEAIDAAPRLEYRWAGR